MNFCPECGEIVELQRTEEDAATQHNYYHCSLCRADWEEVATKGKSGIEEVLRISPVKE